MISAWQIILISLATCPAPARSAVTSEQGEKKPPAQSLP